MHTHMPSSHHIIIAARSSKHLLPILCLPSLPFSEFDTLQPQINAASAGENLQRVSLGGAEKWCIIVRCQRIVSKIIAVNATIKICDGGGA